MSEPLPSPRYSQRRETVHVASGSALEGSLCGNKQHVRTSWWLLTCQDSHEDIVKEFQPLGRLYLRVLNAVIFALSVLSEKHE